MLLKVLCFLAILALAAAAPNSDRQYIDQIQREYDDDRYVDSTEDYGSINNMQQQFEDTDEQNSKLKDAEQYEPEPYQTEGIEQTDYRDDLEQTDDGENIEQTNDHDNIEQTNEKEDIEQIQHSIEDDMQEIEQTNHDTEDTAEKIEQEQQTGDYWKQQHETNENDEDDKIQFPEDMDDLESDSAIGKLFGDSTVHEQEPKYGYDQDQQQAEVGRGYDYNEEKLPVEEEVPAPSYKSNYGSEYSGIYKPSNPFEPEVYTKKPWYKRVWSNTKEKARNFAHKVKETFGKK